MLMPKPCSGGFNASKYALELVHAFKFKSIDLTYYIQMYTHLLVKCLASDTFEGFC